MITVKSEAGKISRAIKQGNYFGAIAEKILVECKSCKGKIIFARNWAEISENKPYITLFCTMIMIAQRKLNSKINDYQHRLYNLIK